MATRASITTQPVLDRRRCILCPGVIGPVLAFCFRAHPLATPNSPFRTEYGLCNVPTVAPSTSEIAAMALPAAHHAEVKDAPDEETQEPQAYDHSQNNP